MTITPEINNQFEALQKLIDGYKERTAQLENDVCLAFPGLFLLSFFFFQCKISMFFISTFYSLW